MAELYLRDDLARAWAGADPFQRAAQVNGQVYRAVANRRTVRFETGGRAYFAKIHRGTGWREIVKNLLTLRVPVTGARNEFEACRHLARAGVAAPTVAGFGERGWNPADRFSFVVCDALEGRDSLEDLVAAWQRRPPAPVDKRRLIAAVARFAAAMHGAGVIHRDFYVCHLLLDRAAWRRGETDLAVIDLHRARIYPRVPEAWLRRDLAALLFSVLEAPLSRRDWLRFLAVYRNRSWRQVLRDEGPFWDAVHRRALALYRKGRRKGLVTGGPSSGGTTPESIPELDAADLAAAGRHLPDVFALHLAAAAPLPGLPEVGTGPVRLVCRRVFRLLPGRRVVALVALDDRLAVMKLFLGAGADRYRAREAEGCALLAAAGVPTPALLGELNGGPGRGPAARALLLEYLTRAQPVAPGDLAGGAAAAARLARLHQAGCRHHDLHLDNFLSQDGEVYVIDGDAVRPARLNEARSIEDLAVLCAQRPPLADADLPRIFAAYASERGWTPNHPARLAALADATRRQRRDRVRRFLSKAQRDCTEFVQLGSWRRWLVAVRGEWDALATFAEDPEAVLRDGRVLKAGNSATVLRVRVGGRDRVVKRYNLKGPWHALRRAVKPMARFRLAWLNGQRLRFLQIPTARPLMLLERRRGPVRGVAYLVMEDLGDRSLADEIETNGLTEARLGQVADLFRALEAAGLRHGDTKASNFLVTATGVHLVDLDALQEGGDRHKDVARFLANFDHLPEVRERFRRALPPSSAAGGFAGSERPL